MLDGARKSFDDSAERTITVGASSLAEKFMGSTARTGRGLKIPGPAKATATATKRAMTDFMAMS